MKKIMPEEIPFVETKDLTPKDNSPIEAEKVPTPKMEYWQENIELQPQSNVNPVMQGIINSFWNR